MDEEDDFDVEEGESLEEEAPVVAEADESLGSRQKLRAQLQSEVEAFLARGGVIQQIDSNVTSDPPQKPGNNYGSRPI